MIHKRNLFLTAMAWGAIVTGVLVLFPDLRHTIVGTLHLPALALAVILAHYLTGDGLHPPEVIGWSSFVAYTLCYWIVVLIFYVMGLEFYLLHKVLHHLDDAQQHLIPVDKGGGIGGAVFDGTDPQKALDKIGLALQELEGKRRHHWLLKQDDVIGSLDDAPHLVAARAVSRSEDSLTTKRLLKQLAGKISVKTSPAKSAEIMKKLRNDAKRFSAGGQSGTQGKAGGSPPQPGTA